MTKELLYEEALRNIISCVEAKCQDSLANAINEASELLLPQLDIYTLKVVGIRSVLGEDYISDNFWQEVLNNDLNSSSADDHLISPETLSELLDDMDDDDQTTELQKLRIESRIKYLTEEGILISLGS